MLLQFMLPYSRSLIIVKLLILIEKCYFSLAGQVPLEEVRNVQEEFQIHLSHLIVK